MLLLLHGLLVEAIFHDRVCISGAVFGHAQFPRVVWEALMLSEAMLNEANVFICCVWKTMLPFLCLDASNRL